MPKQKLYCYVDETGQDIGSKFFLVSVVILEKERDEIRQKLRELEKLSGKNKRSGPEQTTSNVGSIWNKL